MTEHTEPRQTSGSSRPVGHGDHADAVEPAADPARATHAPGDYPEMSDFFATVRIDEGASIRTDSDGDLWPTTWADHGHLYNANGDGAGFSDGEYTDIVVSRIEGTPASGITGERLASGRDVAPIWGDPAMVNSKPTGIVAVDGNGDGRDELYLAVQDLACTPDRIFDEAPAAGVVASEDYGRTWRAPDGPMFTDHTFTTVMFL